eukprot:387741-Rhodomonas_salina.1
MRGNAMHVAKCMASGVRTNLDQDPWSYAKSIRRTSGTAGTVVPRTRAPRRIDYQARYYCQ